ncbi:bZIP transcription factor 1 [Phytophthora citrophthora]|uniref:BZIP transcription factor 1 n=1 Tax=Phytophthora citrophthora TaxID=4793 RepID=A0AAD9LH60_9STRA|nr:bZIP transcription factor 1 [Phytophthora citrophthora]
MDSCVLHPPTRFLSDNVISGVVQRTRKVSASDRQWAPPSPKRKRQDSGYTGSSELMMLAHSSHDVAKKTAEDALANVVTQDWFVEQQKHQREIRRVRQIRYRKKQQDYMTTLEESNRELQQEILQLEKRRRAIFAAVPSEKTLWNVAVEYFRVFQYGFRASDLTNNKSSVQLDFLRASMAPDVLYNAGRGVEAILKNWTYFSLWFKDVEVQLDGLKKNGQESLIAKTTTTFIITEKTVANVFPHLTGPNADGLLAGKLLGQKIVLQGSTRFDWDSGYGRVTSVISESDMLTPMLRVLGSLEDVSKVFEKSLISLTPYRGQLRMRS